MMSIKKVTLPILAMRDKLCLALSLVVRQWGKSAAKGIIFFYSKLCFTVDRCNSAGALSKGVYTVLKMIIWLILAGLLVFHFSYLDGFGLSVESSSTL